MVRKKKLVEVGREVYCKKCFKPHLAWVEVRKDVWQMFECVEEDEKLWARLDLPHNCIKEKLSQDRQAASRFREYNQSRPYSKSLTRGGNG